MRLFVSLTTIPSKFPHIYNTIDSLLAQTVVPDQILLHIPKTYSFRFGEQQITDLQIAELEAKYSGQPILVHRIEHDYGPGTKLLGMFEPDLFFPEDSYVILVDDDLIYHKRLLESFRITLTDLHYEAASFDMYEITNFPIGQCSHGYMIQWNRLNQFRQYYDLIRNQDYVNYQDDIYISFYLFLKKIKMNYLRLDNNEPIFMKTVTAELDGLHNLENKYNRDSVNENTTAILEKMKIEGQFDFIF